MSVLVIDSSVDLTPARFPDACAVHEESYADAEMYAERAFCVRGETQSSFQLENQIYFRWEYLPHCRRRLRLPLARKSVGTVSRCEL